MPPRSKSLVVLAFVLFAVYLLFWHDDRPLNSAQPKSADILNAYLQELEAAEQEDEAEQAAKGYIDLSEGFEPLEETTTWDPYLEPTQDSGLLQSNTMPVELEVTTTELERTTAWNLYPEPTRDSELLEELEDTETELEPTTTWEPYPEPTQDSELLESSTIFEDSEASATELEPTTTWEPDYEPTGANELLESITSSAEQELSTAEPGAGKSRVSLQEQFEKESAALAKKKTAGIIYGTTLNDLFDSGAHKGFPATALTATEVSLSYSETTPYKYDVYPDYNSKVWKAANIGIYVPCDGPEGALEDILVFSGRPQAFGEPPMGSYKALDIDSNLCFERETRLGPYGFQEEPGPISSSDRLRKRMDWDSINWGSLQQKCARRNSDRYAQVQGVPRPTDFSAGEISKSPARYNRTGKSRRLETIPVEDSPDYSKETSTVRKEPKSRTAIIIRTHSEQNYTENDKQNIRALITELSLRSGGEYQVYLLVQVKDENLPIWTNANVYYETVQNSVPKEFWNMTVLWNDAEMEELYPKITPKANNVHKSQWFSVQKFAQDYPGFDYYWNWEFDTRYTGHYYDLLEKLATFGKYQPRKYLWERNERYYIPSIHGAYSHFRKTVEPESDKDTIWGAVADLEVRPVGPTRPDIDPKEDTYTWGVGEDADYISLAPMFNPIGTKWVGRHDIWGFLGHEKTLRRATIGTQSRCSKLLLDTMHNENLKGNHANSEMTPQTVALLHGLKAVYAPIPIFFDKAWNGSSLAKYFNPGRKGESGSIAESPFSLGKEGRFEGSTWHYRATPPMKLYNNWLGWEDSGIGGPEWEQSHGRICLPPMLLHPVKDVVKPPEFLSESDLPYAADNLR